MKSWTMALRRQSKNGPTNTYFVITAVDKLSELQGNPLIADLEYQANNGMESMFDESIPVRVHIFEQDE